MWLEDLESLELQEQMDNIVPFTFYISTTQKFALGYNFGIVIKWEDLTHLHAFPVGLIVKLHIL